VISNYGIILIYSDLSRKSADNNRKGIIRNLREKGYPQYTAALRAFFGRVATGVFARPLGQSSNSALNVPNNVDNPPRQHSLAPRHDLPSHAVSERLSKGEFDHRASTQRSAVSKTKSNQLLLLDALQKPLPSDFERASKNLNSFEKSRHFDSFGVEKEDWENFRRWFLNSASERVVAMICAADDDEQLQLTLKRVYFTDIEEDD